MANPWAGHAYNVSTNLYTLANLRYTKQVTARNQPNQPQRPLPVLQLLTSQEVLTSDHLNHALDVTNNRDEVDHQ